MTPNNLIRTALLVALLVIARGVPGAAAFEHCATPGPPGAAVAGQGQPKPVIRIDAASMQSDLNTNLTLLEGEVHLVNGLETLDADQLRFDSGTRQVEASGQLHIVRPGLDVTGARADYNLDKGTGAIDQPVFTFPTEGFVAYGHADRADLGEGNTTHFENIVFSTCRPGARDWFLQADRLTLDRDGGTGIAEGAHLEFLGIKLPELPEFSFPIDRRNRSGFLLPAVGYTGSSGAFIKVPYYWHLADNYDLTVAPRVMSERGVEIGAEFRFLTRNTEGEVFGSIIPRDYSYENGRQTRGKAGIVTHSEFGAHWVGDISAQYASDSDYTGDLGSGLYDNSTSHLGRTAQAEYRQQDWRLLLRVQGFQTIDDTISRMDRPYNRLPQVRFDWAHEFDQSGVQLGLDSEYANFTRDNSIEGQRLDIMPAVSWSWRKPWGYVKPGAAFRLTRYDLRNAPPGQAPEPDRALGILSLDSGLFFDRQTHWAGQAVSQSLEPRLFYLYVPYEDQSDLPVFDTSEIDFTFDNLFRSNRFSGPDRQGDANRLTLAVSSHTVAAESGRELLTVNLGQTFHFDDARVTLPDTAPVKRGSSALVAEVAAYLNREWRARAGIQVATDRPGRNIEQSLAQLVYRDERRNAFSATWRQRAGQVENTDFGAVWRLSPTTSLLGRWNYSLRDDRTQELMGGVEYGNCCWRLRALARRYTDDSDRDYDTAVMLQIELNGIGHLGDNVEKFIQRGIYAYRTDYQ